MISFSDILKARLLIVDEEEANILLLEEMLRNAGYLSIASTTDPGEVRELHRRNDYDLILLDLQMPGTDGFQVMEGLRESETGGCVSVLVITAQPGHWLRARKAGAKDFISKPFDLAEVLTRVYNMLEVRLLLLETKKLREQVVAGQKVAEQYLGVFRSSPVAVSINTVAEGRIIDVNEQCCRFFGYSREEIIGRSLIDFHILVQPEDRVSVMQRLLKDGAIRDLETRLRRRLGEVRHVVASLELIKVAGEDEPVLISMFIDITDRKRAEERLLAAHRQAQRLLDHSPAVIYSLGIREGGAVPQAVSGSVARLLGFTVEECTRDWWVNHVHPEDMERAFPSITATLERGVLTAEYRIQRKDGRYIWVEDRRQVVCDPEGIPIEIAGVWTDITDRRQGDGMVWEPERRLSESEESYREAQSLRSRRRETIGTFAGGLAHNLNNVLAPILMSIELLRMKFADDEGLRMLDVLETSAQRGADIVRQVLTYSRGLEGKRAPVPIKHLIQEMRTIVRQIIPRSIQLRTEVSTDVWPLIGDARQLHQALLNLCVNARDAMAGGGTLTIKVENIMLDESFARSNAEAQTGPYVVMTVTDTGTGIPPHVRERIFDPFFTTKPLDQGAGLGLSTVLGIVKRHTGFISVHSEMGKGAQFKVYIPAMDSESTYQSETGGAAPPMGHGELILVVDDEAAILDISEQSLRMSGYRVLTASDGAQAIAICAQNRGQIKVMLTDMMMPVMDGPATICAARTIDPDIKIIAASASGAAGGAADPRLLSANAFLPKPYTAEHLLKVVWEVLESSKAAAN